MHEQALLLSTRMMNVSRLSKMASRIYINRIILAAASSSNGLMGTLNSRNPLLVVTGHGSPIKMPFTRTPYPLAWFYEDALSFEDTVAPPGLQQRTFRVI